MESATVELLIQAIENGDVNAIRQTLQCGTTYSTAPTVSPRDKNLKGKPALNGHRHSNSGKVPRKPTSDPTRGAKKDGRGRITIEPVVKASEYPLFIGRRSGAVAPDSRRPRHTEVPNSDTRESYAQNNEDGHAESERNIDLQVEDLSEELAVSEYMVMETNVQTRVTEESRGLEDLDTSMSIQRDTSVSDTEDGSGTHYMNMVNSTDKNDITKMKNSVVKQIVTLTPVDILQDYENIGNENSQPSVTAAEKTVKKAVLLPDSDENTGMQTANEETDAEDGKVAKDIDNDPEQQLKLDDKKESKKQVADSEENTGMQTAKEETDPQDGTVAKDINKDPDQSLQNGDKKKKPKEQVADRKVNDTTTSMSNDGTPLATESSTKQAEMVPDTARPHSSPPPPLPNKDKHKKANDTTTDVSNDGRNPPLATDSGTKQADLGTNTARPHSSPPPPLPNKDKHKKANDTTTDMINDGRNPPTATDSGSEEAELVPSTARPHSSPPPPPPNEDEQKIRRTKKTPNKSQLPNDKTNKTVAAGQDNSQVLEAEMMEDKPQQLQQTESRKKMERKSDQKSKEKTQTPQAGDGGTPTHKTENTRNNGTSSHKNDSSHSNGALRQAETGETIHSQSVGSSHAKSASSMASVMDRFKKKKGQQTPEWSRNGSFLNKPEVGWIHPDQQLNPDAGICYGVRYIGNVEVKESMKSLDFDTRTQVAREAISRVAEAAGLKTATKKRKVDKRVARMLGENPHMHYAGANVNLTITTDSINLMVMETGEIIADHPMHVVSFASGGDAETLDFVAYVAKDPALGRACHVLECGGGLSEDVVTTVGQAFELRFKQYLQKQPKAVQLPDREESGAFEAEKWGEQEDYYNDRPGAVPPSPPPDGAAPAIPPVPSQYNATPCNVPKGHYMSVKDDHDGGDEGGYSKARDQGPNLIDFGDGKQIYDNRKGASSEGKDRDEEEDSSLNPYDNRAKVANGDTGAANGLDDSDPFDMEAMASTIAADSMKGKSKGQKTFVDKHADGGADAADGGADEGVEIDLRENPSGHLDGGPSAPVFEEWYHSKISRKEAEKLLELDGDFLVRESSNSMQQFVLSGKQGGHMRHLLLVDPEGIVRTKDFIFDSVSHLINYHRQNSLPIITQGSELRLVRPIKTCISSI